MNIFNMLVFSLHNVSNVNNIIPVYTTVKKLKHKEVQQLAQNS